eukprot:12261862-Alexandrium_andersonii.AAC.1
MSASLVGSEMCIRDRDSIGSPQASMGRERYVDGARTRQGINRGSIGSAQGLGECITRNESELSQDSMKNTQELNGDCRGAQYVGAQRGAYKD